MLKKKVVCCCALALAIAVCMGIAIAFGLKRDAADIKKSTEAGGNSSVKNNLLLLGDERSSAEINDNGISVSLARGDTFTYNEIINLNTDGVAPLLRFTHSPIETGVADAATFKVRLADIYDNSNFITICFKNLSGQGAWADPNTYVTVGAFNQPQCGLENGNLHVNDYYGTPVYYSMVGRPATPQLDREMCVYFDYNEKQLFVDREIYSNGNRGIVADLDDVNHFPKAIWKGFTTGEVKLSFSADNYQAGLCNFTLTSVCGNSVRRNFSDTEAPIITVDSGYGLTNMPDGSVGIAYPVAEATAFDKYDGNLDVTVRVYLDYNSSAPVPVELTNGAFVPEAVGTYTVIYTAEDASANSAIVSYNVKVKDNAAVLSLNTDAVPTSGATGAVTDILGAVVPLHSSGNVAYKVTVTHIQSGAVVETDADGKFVPMRDGDYSVKIEAYDHISSAEKTIIFTAVRSLVPQVYDDTVINRYYVKNTEYSLPKLYAYDFSSGSAVKNSMALYVKESGKEERALSGNSFTPSAVGETEIIYRFTSNGNIAEKRYVSTVIDTGYGSQLQKDKYFIATEGSATSSKTSDGITYTVNKDAVLEFVNPVQVKQFTLQFEVSAKYSFSSLNIYLTDMKTDEEVKFSFAPCGESSAFSLNGKPTCSSGAAFGSGVFDILFNCTDGIVYGSIARTVAVNKYYSGKDYNGFTEMTAYLKIQLEGVTGESQFIVKTLNSQKFDTKATDDTGPQILVDNLNGEYAFNEELTFDKAFAFDVFGCVKSLTMSVKSPDGNFAVAIDDTVMNGEQSPFEEYVVKLTQYGNYTVSYSAVDGANVKSEYSYTVTVADKVPPTITLGTAVTEARTGDTVKIASATVTDNLNENCTLAVFVKKPDGVFLPADGMSFVAESSGNYTVYYMAFDESGNYIYHSYNVRVS